MVNKSSWLQILIRFITFHQFPSLQSTFLYSRIYLSRTVSPEQDIPISASQVCGSFNSCFDAIIARFIIQLLESGTTLELGSVFIQHTSLMENRISMLIT